MTSSYRLNSVLKQSHSMMNTSTTYTSSITIQRRRNSTRINRFHRIFFSYKSINWILRRSHIDWFQRMSSVEHRQTRPIERSDDHCSFHRDLRCQCLSDHSDLGLHSSDRSSSWLVRTYTALFSTTSDESPSSSLLAAGIVKSIPPFAVTCPLVTNSVFIWKEALAWKSKQHIDMNRNMRYCSHISISTGKDVAH